MAVLGRMWYIVNLLRIKMYSGNRRDSGEHNINGKTGRKRRYGYERNGRHISDVMIYKREKKPEQTV